MFAQIDSLGNVFSVNSQAQLIAWAFDQGGTPLFNREDIHRITPQNLYMLYHTLVCVGPATPIR